LAIAPQDTHRPFSSREKRWPTGRFSIRHDNSIKLRERDADGAARHWILEIHFVDRARMFGGFFEELLTIGLA